MTLITTSTLRITYRIGTRDGRGNFKEKWLGPLLWPRLAIQPSLKFYFEGQAGR